MKKILLILCFCFVVTIAYAKQKESYYQRIWCNANGGQTEVILNDKSRVDCITDQYAIEFDFAKKWAEAIGQSLFYSAMTGKKAGIVLITNSKSKWYINRLNKTIKDEKLDIKVWYIDSNLTKSFLKP